MVNERGWMRNRSQVYNSWRRTGTCKISQHMLLIPSFLSSTRGIYAEMQELWFQTKSTWYLCDVYTGKVHIFRLEIWTLDIIVILTINFRSSGWREDYMTLSWCWRNRADIPAGDMSQWINTLRIHCVSTRFNTIVLIFQLARGITLQRSFWRRRGADLRTRDRITWKRSVWLRGADPPVGETSTTPFCCWPRGADLPAGETHNWHRHLVDEKVQIFRLKISVPDAGVLLEKRKRFKRWVPDSVVSRIVYASTERWSGELPAQCRADGWRTGDKAYYQEPVQMTPAPLITVINGCIHTHLVRNPVCF